MELHDDSFVLSFFVLFLWFHDFLVFLFEAFYFALADNLGSGDNIVQLAFGKFFFWLCALLLVLLLYRNCFDHVVTVVLF